MDSPLVSICIPAYNSARHVRRALESAIHQTYRNIEIVVVDNASKDNTKDVVQEYARRDSRIQFFQNETNIGSGNNFLKAFEHASGHFAQALGSDDWLSQNYIEEGVRMFEKYPDAASIISDIISFSLDNNTERLNFLDGLSIKAGTYSADWFFRGIYKGYAPTGFISFLRREDMIAALRAVMADPVNLLDRGDRREPMDMPVFLELLAHYRYLAVTKKSAYIKTIHGKDHVGLRGDFFKDAAGRVRYALATRRAYEVFYVHHGLTRHFRELRFWTGLSAAAHALRFLFGSNDKRNAGYRTAIGDFFSDYSMIEKLFLWIGFLPYVPLKAFTRCTMLFRRRAGFHPDENYFVSQDFQFRV